jgi:DNA-directed RNA polymerase specialized sigma24 family protein
MGCETSWNNTECKEEEYKTIDSEELEALYSQHRPIIWSALNRYGRSLSFEEKEQCGYIGLWKAIRKQDDRLSKPSTHIYNMVKYECLMGKRQEARQTEGHICSGIMEEEAVYSEPSLTEQLSDELLDMRFRRNLTYQEIGDILGTSLDVARKLVLFVGRERAHTICGGFKTENVW